MEDKVKGKAGKKNLLKDSDVFDGNPVIDGWSFTDSPTGGDDPLKMLLMKLLSGAGGQEELGPGMAPMGGPMGGGQIPL